MDGKKWQDRWIGPVRETLGKLSAAQRLSLGLLGASLLVGLATLALRGSSEEMTLVPIADAAEATEFAGWLADERISHEISPGGVLVPRDELPYVQLRSRVLHAEGNRPDYFQFVDEAASLTETDRSRSDRWSYGNKRQIEDDLRRSIGIRDATITFTPSRRRTTVMRKGDAAASAAVHLTIDESRYPGGRLPTGIARVVGKHVAAALGLGIGNVSVMDNHGNGYDLSAAGSLGGVEDDPEARIRAKISDLVEQSFPIGAFAVVVDVRRNLRQSAIVEESVDPQNTVSLPKRGTTESSRDSAGALAHGVEPNVARLGSAEPFHASARESEPTETEFVNDWGRREVRTEVPPGEVEGVTVTLEVDLATVVQIIGEEQRIKGNTAWEGKGEALLAELERFRALWEQKLEQSSSLDEEQVKAQVGFSARPRAGDSAPATTAGSSFLAWISAHAGSLVLVLLSIGGGLILLRAVRGGGPEPAELPDPVAELEAFLARREERIAAEAAMRSEGGRDLGRREPWTVPDGDQDALELLEEVMRYAQEQPQVAATVVKQWLREASGVRVEEAS